MQKTLNGLVPLYNTDYDNYAKLKIGWEGEVEFYENQKK